MFAIWRKLRRGAKLQIDLLSNTSGGSYQAAGFAAAHIARSHLWNVGQMRRIVEKPFAVQPTTLAHLIGAEPQGLRGVDARLAIEYERPWRRLITAFERPLRANRLRARLLGVGPERISKGEGRLTSRPLARGARHAPIVQAATARTRRWFARSFGSIPTRRLGSAR